MTDLNTISVAELTAMYNQRVPAEKQIKKFETKASAIARLTPILEAEEKAATEAAAAKAEKKAKRAAKEPKPKAEKKDKGPSRFERLVTILRERSSSVDALAADFGTTPKVILNDVCDIRKMLPDSEQLTRTKVEDVSYYQITAK